MMTASTILFEGGYMGVYKLTRGQVETLMTTLFVSTILLAVLTVFASVSIIVTKVAAVRAKMGTA